MTLKDAASPGGRADGRAGGKGKLIAAAVAVALVVAAGRYFDLPALLTRAMGWVAAQGAAGVVVYVLLYILACVLFLPGSILTLGAGAVWGVLGGVPVVSVASTLGATAAFLVGRYLARDWVARKIQGNDKFQAIDEAVAREGWKIVGLTRLSPIFPFNLLNYAFGLTRVSLRHYIVASWVGMIPGTVMYVYLGSLAGSLAALGSGRSTRTPAQWAMYAVGLVATVAVTVYVTRLARAALAKRV
jgi:uncharacterized membrane protein YdjX (TVP38/TMEM64 family)